ncbi:unnamed protein product [Fraxinus pennsylvanica]|uniref:B3 domain-containing protein n=1 Tax=Fraxinus pennsylvanica TaxID=56036 RepID=A0AAD1ZLS7_9LAMI|nr:unnamed protein product [Fraxinus pennsylvanica]
MMKKQSVSFNLFDDEDLHLPLPIPNVFPMKKKKVVSLSLFDDLLLHDQPPPPSVPPQTHHQKLYSNPNLKRTFHDINPEPILEIVPYSGQTMPQSAVTLQKNRKRKGNGKITSIRSQVQIEPEPRPEPLLLEILRELGLNGGTVPIFLYQKRLTSSDTKPDQNRIFLSHNREKVMEFLTQMERQLVEVNQGSVEILTIDPKGKYYVLHMRRWGTLKMVVLKKDWSKLVEANKLEESDWIQLWGYRQNSQFHLALNFKKATRKAIDQDAASSSSGCSPSIVSEV